MRKYWITQRVEEENTLRKKFKNDPEGFRRAEDQLRNDTGARYWQNNEICIRHAEGIRSDNPVLAKLWYFWTNHFTISDTQSLAEFSTGAYHRDFIRANMDKNFETMAIEATIAWPMMMHLDNKDNEGPKSISAKEEWRRREKRPATLNENHARELMELHTISPQAGYTQKDVEELAKIMTGWRPKWTKNKDMGNDVTFHSDRHEPGKKYVLGNEYKKGSNNKVACPLHPIREKNLDNRNNLDHRKISKIQIFSIIEIFFADRMQWGSNNKLACYWGSHHGLPRHRKSLTRVV